MTEKLELNTLVAEKVLGLKVCKCDHYKIHMDMAMKWQERCKDPMENHAPPRMFSHNSENNCNYCGNAYMPFRNYSTDISWAWQVTEKLMELENQIEVSASQYIAANKTVVKDFSCTINHGRWLGKKLTFRTGQSIPEAICFAALDFINDKSSD